MQPKQIKFTDLTPGELGEKFSELGESPYRARQLSKWIYLRRNFDTETHTDFSKPLRQKIAETFDFSLPEVRDVLSGADGTFKFLVGLKDGLAVESVVMNHGDHHTLCVSSQVGCAMGCKFCMTGTMGLRRNLSCGEIVDQVLLGAKLLGERKGERLRNLVFMGMGEPLHNYAQVVRSLRILTDAHCFDFSTRRITVSTSGLAKQIAMLADEDRFLANLAVSLNAPNQKRREELMPIGKKFKLDALIDACGYFTRKTGKLVTFEYIMMKGVSDSMEDAASLLSLLSGFRAKLNLILYNDNPGLGFYRPDADAVYRFQRYLLDRGMLATQRHSKGQDIAAACGQLAVRDQNSRRRSKTSETSAAGEGVEVRAQAG